MHYHNDDLCLLNIHIASPSPQPQSSPIMLTIEPKVVTISKHIAETLLDFYDVYS